MNRRQIRRSHEEHQPEEKESKLYFRSANELMRCFAYQASHCYHLIDRVLHKRKPSSVSLQFILNRHSLHAVYRQIMRKYTAVGICLFSLLYLIIVMIDVFGAKNWWTWARRFISFYFEAWSWQEHEKWANNVINMSKSIHGVDELALNPT